MMDRSTKKRLLITTSTFPKDKDDAISARFVFDLAVSLRKFYEVYVLAPSSADSETIEDIEGIHILRFRYFFPVSLQKLSSGNGILSDIRTYPLAILEIPFFLISQLYSTIKIIKDNKIDIMSSHWLIPQGFIGALAKKITGVKHVVTPHAAGVFALNRTGAAGRIISRFIRNNSDASLPVSSYIKTISRKIGALNELYKIVPMGVDLEKFCKQKNKEMLRKKYNVPDNFTLLFVGKLSPKKGVGFLLDALSDLKKDNTDFTLLVAGGGPEERVLRDKANESGLAENVVFLGWIKNDLLPDLYSLSDVLVVPSIIDQKGETEGMPVVINEAMACELPVLASDVSGIPDVVKDGVNGWLFSYGDKGSLLEKIRTVRSIQNLDIIGNEAYKTACSNSYDNAAKAYKKVIDRIKEDAGNDFYSLKIKFMGDFIVEINSKYRSYVDFFLKEYPEVNFADCEQRAASDLVINVDCNTADDEDGDIVLDETFKKIHKYKCIIEGIRESSMRISYTTSWAARTVYPFMAAVFLQTEIIEPFVYMKMLEKGHLMLHSSAVFNNNGAYLFSGPSGMGKTTIALHLVARGLGFLGDDIVILSDKAEITAYPRRIHFFSYLKAKNPFLKIPFFVLVSSHVRYYLRQILKLITGKNFYFSTRLSINDIIPGAKIGYNATAKRIFIIKPESLSGDGGSYGDLTASYDYMIKSCDTRKSLLRILRSEKDLIDRIMKKESAIMNSIAGKVDIENIVRDDPLTGIDSIADTIRSK